MQDESAIEHGPDTSAAAAEDATDVTEELLVEEVSIDGMCGVY